MGASVSCTCPYMHHMGFGWSFAKVDTDVRACIPNNMPVCRFMYLLGNDAHAASIQLVYMWILYLLSIQLYMTETSLIYISLLLAGDHVCPLVLMCIHHARTRRHTNYHICLCIPYDLIGMTLTVTFKLCIHQISNFSVKCTSMIITWRLWSLTLMLIYMKIPCHMMFACCLACIWYQMLKVGPVCMQ